MSPGIANRLVCVTARAVGLPPAAWQASISHSTHCGQPFAIERDKAFQFSAPAGTVCVIRVGRVDNSGNLATRSFVVRSGTAILNHPTDCIQIDGIAEISEHGSSNPERVASA